MTERLKKIVSAIPFSEELFDVGCDHGIVGVNALLQKKAQRVVFTDVSRPSLEKARALAIKNGLHDKCEFLCGDGFCGRRAETAVIAGMGGLEISKILLKAEELPDRLVLQPMRGVPELRLELSKNYFLERDEIFFDGKFYCLIYAERGSDSLTEQEIKYGKTNLRQKSVDFHKFLFEETVKCDKILVNGNHVPEVERRKAELDLLLANWREQ